MGVGAGLYMYNVVPKKVTFAISSPYELLVLFLFSRPTFTIIIMKTYKTPLQGLSNVTEN